MNNKYGDIQPGTLRGTRPDFGESRPDPDQDLIELLRPLSASDMRSYFKDHPGSRERFDAALARKGK